MDTNINVNANTSGARGQMKALGNDVKDLDAALKEATDSGNWKAAADIAAAINSLSSAQKTQGSIASQQQKQQKSGVQDKMLGAINTLGASISQFAKGDYAGAAISGVRGAGVGLRNMGKDRLAQDPNDETGKLLKNLGFAVSIFSTVAQAGNALAEAYEKAEHNMVGLNRLYVQHHHNLEENNKLELKYFNLASRNQSGRYMGQYSAELGMNTYTGLKTDEFLDAVANAAQYGTKRTSVLDKNGNAKSQETIDDENMFLAMQETQKLGQMSYATGVDLGAMQEFQGTIRRMGGEGGAREKDSGKAVQIAYGALNATGMEKSQFGELLAGMQRVLEDGIESGFTKSAREIAGEFNMFAKLSGNNPYWQGKQGAERIVSMGHSIAGSTALSSADDVIMYKAAQSALSQMDKEKRLEITGEGKWNNTPIDTYLMLEHGATPEFMGEYFKTVQGIYGDNTRGQIEEYKRGFDLNYTGAVKLYELSKKAGSMEDKDYEKEVEEIQLTYGSNESKMIAAQNTLNNTVVNIGEKLENMKIAGLDKIGVAVQGIYDFLIHENKMPNVGVFTPSDASDQPAYNKLRKAYEDKNTSGEVKADFENAMYKLGALDPQKIAALNWDNTLNAGIANSANPLQQFTQNALELVTKDSQWWDELLNRYNNRDAPSYENKAKEAATHGSAAAGAAIEFEKDLMDAEHQGRFVSLDENKEALAVAKALGINESGAENLYSYNGGKVASNWGSETAAETILEQGLMALGYSGSASEGAGIVSGLITQKELDNYKAGTPGMRSGIEKEIRVRLEGKLEEQLGGLPESIKGAMEAGWKYIAQGLSSGSIKIE